MKASVFIRISLLLLSSAVFEQSVASTKSGFDIVVLGTDGGVASSSLSSFLIGPHKQAYSVACDAGNLIDGIQAGIQHESFKPSIRPANYPLSLTGYVLREHIKGYLITHAHLDHIAGLLIASPEDSSKPIYALPSVISAIKQTHFNWQSWPNFANDGKKPSLSKYVYTPLINQETAEIPHTDMRVTAFPLSHNGVESSAFVIEHRQELVVCLGDTGPDSVEKSDKLKALWTYLQSYIQQGRLKAIVMESSFVNDTPDNTLFGHLTPFYVNQELEVLANLAKQGKNSVDIRNLPVIISHIKPSLKQGHNVKQQILQELNAGNTTGVRFIVPYQGQLLHVQ